MEIYFGDKPTGQPNYVIGSKYDPLLAAARKNPAQWLHIRVPHRKAGSVAAAIRPVARVRGGGWRIRSQARDSDEFGRVWVKWVGTP